MRKFWFLLSRDFSVSSIFKNKVINILCLIILHLIFNLSMKKADISVSYEAIFNICFVFVMLLNINNIFGDDLKDGTIDTLRSFGVSQFQIFKYKAINFMFLIIMPVLVTEVMTGLLFYNLPIMVIFKSVFYKFIVLPTLAFLSVFISYATKAISGGAVLTLLYFPLIIVPVMLIGLVTNNPALINGILAYGAIGLFAFFIN